MSPLSPRVASAIGLSLLVGMLCGCRPSPEAASEEPAGAVAESSRPPGSSSEEIKQRFAAIQGDMGSSSSYSPDVVRRLQALHEEAPDFVPAWQALVRVYDQRKDWDGLVQLISEKPAHERSTEDRISLATILSRGQRYEEALQAVEGLVQADGTSDNVEAAWITAFAAFHSNDLERTAIIIDAHAAQFQERHPDALLLRGLIHLREGELEQARQRLSQLLEINEENPSAHDALGRTLVAAGQPEEAQVHLNRATTLREIATTNKQLALRLSAMSKALSAAWQRQDYPACERYINEMLPHVDQKNKVELLKFRAAVCNAQGRPEEAAEAMRQAQDLSGNPS